jgi:site-specific DNA recombinase
MTRRAAIYARVSTDDQADKGYSLPSQLEGCRSYAQQLGYEVVAEFRDDFTGATPVSERPQGRHLNDLVRSRQVNAVIVHQVDRLSRDIVDLLTTVRNWLQAGAEVHALDIGHIESELDIVLVIKGWQGSDERKRIRERSMRGKRTKARTGRVVGTRAPYGYQHLRDENGKIQNFEIVEEEAQIVRLIYQWYVHGDETGKRLSAGQVARRLSEMGLPTPGEVNPGYHRKRDTGMWQTGGILDMISREVYAGIWRYGVRIGPTRNQRPPEEWIEVEVPAIIDRETWDAAQVQRKRNKLFSRRNAKHDYLLHGLVRCSCGNAYTGEFFSNHRYYSCTWRNNHHTKLEKRKCWARSVRADALEADVWESILSIFADRQSLESYLRIAQQEELDALNPKLQELDAVNAMIVSTEHDAVEIGQALKRASGIVACTLEQNMNDVNTRYEALCNRRDELLADVSETRLTDLAIQEIMDFAKDVFVGIENADFETKRRNLEMLNVRILVSEGRFRIDSIAGQWEGEIRKIKPKRKEESVDDLCSREQDPRGCRSRAGRLPPAR